MSSFLQCSIELLNSYNFVKQKKCKRGLLKSKGSHLCLDCVFHPNLWSNLVPSTWAEPIPAAAKGPTAPVLPRACCPPFVALAGLFWPEAAGGRGSQHQLHPGCGLRELLLRDCSPSASLPAALPRLQAQPSPALPARAPRLLLAEHRTHLGLLQEQVKD